MLSTLLAFISLCLLWRSMGRALRKYLVSKTTALEELADLGVPRPGGKIKGTAVIAGGSIAGLFAARMCASHFEDVLIVEPETWLTTEEGTTSHYDVNGNPRPGTTEMKTKRARVFQYGALHAYQSFSLMALRRLFPRWDEEARKSDIRILDDAFKIAMNGVVIKDPTSLYPFTGIPQHQFGSRAAYETLLRRLTLETCPNIRWTTGVVTGVHPDKDNARAIASVTIRLGKDGQEVVQDATLVVDCTGAAQAGAKWLERAGYGTPSTPSTPLPKGRVALKDMREIYNPKMWYRCFDFDIPANVREALPIPEGYDRAGAMYIFNPVAAIENKSVLITRAEGHRIQLAVGGWDVPEDEKPKSLAEIHEFFRSIKATQPIPSWVHEMFDMVANADEDEPMSQSDDLEFLDLKIPPLGHLQYHKVVNMPSNFVVIGDAGMRVNPIFGQGCTKACIGAVTLNSHLMKSKIVATSTSDRDALPADFAETFWPYYAPKVEDIWTGTKLPDYAYKSTVRADGDENADGTFMRLYMEPLIRASHKDAEISDALFLSRNFLAPTTDLVHPKILAKVLWIWATGFLNI